MKTIETVVYDFDKLSDEAKQKAIRNLSDINVEYDWWEFQYDDALGIGLKITGFDIERGSYVNGELIYSVEKCCKLIKENHGDECETRILAERFLHDISSLPENSEETEYGDLYSEIEDEFLSDLCNCYLTLLRDEYEYQTSDEAIIEAIHANEYTFLENGTMKNY